MISFLTSSPEGPDSRSDALQDAEDLMRMRFNEVVVSAADLYEAVYLKEAGMLDTPPAEVVHYEAEERQKAQQIPESPEVINYPARQAAQYETAARSSVPPSQEVADYAARMGNAGIQDPEIAAAKQAVEAAFAGQERADNQAAAQTNGQNPWKQYEDTRGEELSNV